MEVLRLKLLGGCQLSLGNRLLSAELSAKAQGLLVYLITTGCPHSRDVLAGLLWSDFPEHRARANLRDTLCDLKAILPQHLTIEHNRIASVSNHECCVSDAAIFQDHIDQAQQALRQSTVRTTLPTEISARLEEAVGLFEGEFLSGFYVRRAAVFDEWLDGMRAHLHQSAVNALQTLAETYTADGRYSAGVIHTHRLLELEPWREEGHRQLMYVLALSGQQSAALKQYDLCRQILKEELGLDPSRETTTLFQAIRAGELKPADQKLRRYAALPVDDTKFIGREEELVALDKLIADPEIRLINIIGPGGIGKTRLALAAARRQTDRFAHGLTFLPLTALDSGRQLAPALVAMLELSMSRDSSSKEKLFGYLQDKNQLLILDSFEHLLDGKALLSEMLFHAPWLKILVTSRTALNQREEQRFPIGGLTLPLSRTKLGIMEADAPKVFLQSARRKQPDFELLASDLDPLVHICHLVEGMPLALELAAGWTSSTALRRIAEQLENSLDILQKVDPNITDRHASMWSVFESSWQQLSDQERQDFRGLAVFQGGFTSHAAHRIGGHSSLALSRLVSKSLLHYERQPDRYRMHELLRQFAATKLAIDEKEEADWRARHATYYCQLLVSAEDDLKGPAQDEALLAIDAELGNIRRMWRTVSENAHVDLIAGALDALALYCRYRFQPDELVNFCQVAIEYLDLSTTVDEISLQSRRILAKLRTMQAAPYVHATIGSEFLASDHSRQVLDSCRQELLRLASAGEDVRREQAFVTLRLGAQMLIVDLARATKLFEESLAIWKELDDIWGQSEALHYLSSAHLRLQGYDHAKHTWENSLALKRQCGDRRGLADALTMLGIRAASYNITADTRLYAQECFITCSMIRDRANVAEAHWNLGVLMAWAGQYEQSKESLTQAEAHFEELGLRPPAIILGNVLAMLGEYDEVVDYCYRYMATAGATTFTANEARANHWLAYTALAHKEYDQALILIRQSIAAFEACGLEAYAGIGYGLLALAARGLGDRRHLLQYLEKGLTIQMEGGQLGPLGIMLCAPMTAVLLADNDHPKEAIAAYAFATNHPMIANSVWFDEVVGELVRTGTAKLPSDIVQEAQKQGRESDPWQMGEALLELVRSIGKTFT